MRHNNKHRLILWVAKGMFKTGRALRDSLAAALPHMRVLVVRSDSGRFVQRDTDIIVNWGNTTPPNWFVLNDPLYNCPRAVSMAINKLKCFQQLQDHCNIPKWTTDLDTANEWLASTSSVVCRTKLTGFGGQGIVLCTPDDVDVINAPLYTKYKKKKHEYRVHVFNGQVIDICMKRKRKDYPDEINTKIRNMDGGWIFARDDIVIPVDLNEQAILAVETLGLHFGAVDVIWNRKENTCYVLEVNTAPGLVGTSLARYTQAIKEAL